MIKAVLFDFDGVLTTDETGSQSIVNYICKAVNIDKELFRKEYKKYNKDLLIGKKKHIEIWKELCESINKEIRIEILYDSFINIPINYEMLNIVRKIKENYKTAIITDNKKDRIDSIVKHHKLDRWFDIITISAEIGSQKDNEEIFKKPIEKINLKSNECVFIDNSVENLIIPKKMGFETIYYNFEDKKIKNLINQLLKLNIKI